MPTSVFGPTNVGERWTLHLSGAHTVTGTIVGGNIAEAHLQPDDAHPDDEPVRILHKAIVARQRLEPIAGLRGDDRTLTVGGVA